MSDMQEVYDVKELAEFLHCSVAKIYDMRDRGEIRPIKHYRPMSFSKKEVCRLIEKDEEKETKKERELLAENRQLRAEVNQLKKRISRVVQVACEELIEVQKGVGA